MIKAGHRWNSTTSSSSPMHVGWIHSDTSRNCLCSAKWVIENPFGAEMDQTWLIDVTYNYRNGLMILSTAGLGTKYFLFFNIVINNQSQHHSEVDDALVYMWWALITKVYSYNRAIISQSNSSFPCTVEPLLFSITDELARFFSRFSSSII